LGCGLGQSYGVAKSVCIGHQRRGCHNSMRMAFDDPAIHAGGQSKVIRVNNQAVHEVRV